jgi:hypothetical protein
LDTPAVRRYEDAVERYCTVVRAHADGSLGAFLRAAESALSALYSSAADLPEVSPATEQIPEQKENRDQYLRLQGSLAAKLGQYDAYREVFDPTDSEDREPVQYLLSLDLVEILEDIEYGRSLVDPKGSVSRADVLWQWRFDFTSHWGRHAATALKVVNSLLHTQFVEYV